MLKRISQETFDEAVSENKELAELGDGSTSDEEILKETIEQFKQQGVDLSSIDISGGIGRQEFLSALGDLESATNGPVDLMETINNAITTVEQLCDKKYSMWQRNRMLMMTKGGVNALHRLFDAKYSDLVLVRTINLLDDLSRGSEEIRDFFEPGGSDKLCSILRKYFATVKDRDTDKAVVLSALRLARTVCKSENNKNMMMRVKLGELLSEFMIAHTPELGTHIAAVLQECCMLMRGLCVHDDLRRDMSCAYENGRFFLKQQGLVLALMTFSGSFALYPELAAAALQAAKNLIATEEAVKVMAQHGALELIRSILLQNASSAPSEEPGIGPLDTVFDPTVSLVRSAIAVMRNVCADDIRKDKLVSDGTMDLLLAVMTKERFARDYTLMEHAVACLAAITLRSPSNAERLVASGNSMELLAQTMRRFHDRSGLQRQGCLTVRNIAARCVELRPTLLDAGLEDVLRTAGRIMDVVDEAYGALRDLGCEVNYVKVTDQGTVEPVYEGFGEARTRPLHFNPVYDDDTHIAQRVAEEARAPFAAPRAANDHSHSHSHGSNCCD